MSSFGIGHKESSFPTMSANQISPLRQAWYRWKALKLPWRKRFLVGLDLQGNTFWEFRDALSSQQHRMRRIVQCPPTVHLSEVKISPQWHQWLRHTRIEPPSLNEQSQDLIRQENLKVLAAQADARWAAKPSFLNQPAQSHHSLAPLQAADLPKADQEVFEESASRVEENIAMDHIQHEAIDKSAEALDALPKNRSRVKEGKPQVRPTGKQSKDDPWRAARGVQSEDWQPAQWGGTAIPRR
jgi:NADH dehydrogenase [ubiquinone] 1 alpha subcomplex assembly factor 2